MEHLDENVVVAFVLGSLPELEVIDIRLHLDVCQDCILLVTAAMAQRAHAPTEPGAVPDFTKSRGEVGALVSGTRIGPYVIERLLGAGAMGIVYAARDPRLDRTVALKLIRPELANRDGDLGERLRRESKALARLSHPNVTVVYELGAVDDTVFVAMEYVAGTTLRMWLGESIRSVREIVQTFEAAGRGLAAAHAKGLVHRDFKPDNVLLGSDGSVKVSDFGLARAIGDAPDPVTDATRISKPLLTRTGTILGTPAYMAPEQLDGSAIDERTDQFAFCVALYEALAGARPFVGASLEQLRTAIDAAALEPIPRASAQLRRAIARGLAADPAARFPNMGALLAAISPRTRSTRSVLAGIAAVTATAMLVAGLAGWKLTRPSPVYERTLAAVPLHTEFALSPNGYLAMASDRVEVRNLVTGETVSTTIPKIGHRAYVSHIEIVDDHIARWTMYGGSDVYRWNFKEPGEVEREPESSAGTWIGSSENGDLRLRSGLDGAGALAIVRGKTTLRTWPTETAVFETWSVSPSHRRVAYLTPGKFSGHIVVIDVMTGETWRSDAINDPTAVAFAGDDAVVYGRASGRGIYRARLANKTLVGEQLIHDVRDGFVGRLLFGGDRLLYVALTPQTRAKEIFVDASRVRELEPSLVNSVLGWTSAGAELTRNPATNVLELRTSETSSPTRIVLLTDPANATVADGTVIVALRDSGGRRLIAYDLQTSQQRWSLPPGTALAARCARDAKPPCYVALKTEDAAERYRIVDLDPATGALGTRAIYMGKLEDFAVSESGTAIAVTDGGTGIRELDVSTGEIRIIPVELNHPRSIAYSNATRLAVGGTATRAQSPPQLGTETYAVAVIDGKSTKIVATSEGEQLSLVRPSRDGTVILAQGRTFESSLRQVGP